MRPACLGRRASSLSIQRRTGGTRCLPSQAGSLFSYQKELNCQSWASRPQGPCAANAKRNSSTHWLAMGHGGQHPPPLEWAQLSCGTLRLSFKIQNPTFKIARQADSWARRGHHALAAAVTAFFFDATAVRR